jgi:chitinase
MTMSDHTDQVKHPTVEKPTRRPSFLRLVIAVAIAGALVACGQTGSQSKTSPSKSSSTKTGSVEPWFAGYTDVTATSTFHFETPATKAHRDVVLSFIVSAPKDPCTPTWGTAFTLAQAHTGLDLERKIAQLEQQGGGIAVSFGGQLNDELATTCTDVDKLAAAYAEVIDRYHGSTIDLDVEGADLSDRAAGQRRADAIKKLQLDRLASGKSLAVWLTLEVSPSGLTEDGQAAIAEMLRAGVNLAGVNAMTMDYGSSRVNGQSMLAATTGALAAVEPELKILYHRAGSELSSVAVWSKIGATPMIGQNDVLDEVFGLDAAKGLNDFVLSHRMGRVSMWSLNRDITCGPKYVDVKRVSDACSGVSQGGRRFADLLSAGIAGRLSASAHGVSSSSAKALDPHSPGPVRSALSAK